MQSSPKEYQKAADCYKYTVELDPEFEDAWDRLATTPLEYSQT